MKRFFLLLLSIAALSAFQAYAQDDSEFNAYFGSANSKYEKGNYEGAKNTIAKARKNVFGLTSLQRGKLNALDRKCDEAIAFRDHLDVLCDSLSVPFSETKNLVSISAGTPGSLSVASDDPSWCHAELRGKDTLVVTADFNPNKQARASSVTVSMGKVRSKTIPVRQAARPETRRKVTINTRPARTKVYIDGDEKNSPVTFEFLSGEHRILVEKRDYYKADTTLVIADDMSTEDMDVLIRLKPRFGTVRVKAKPEPGYEFPPEGAVLSINGNVVEQPRSVYSFEDDRDVQLYYFYQGQVVPVPISSGGPLTIMMSAKGFYDNTIKVRLAEGEHLDTTLTMIPVTGSFSIIDCGDASEATVTLDGKEIGLARDIRGYRTKTGTHEIKISRTGYLPRKESYTFEVFEDENATPVEVSMVRFNTYVFQSVPDGARVSLNGSDLGIQTPSEPLKITEVPGAEYSFHFHKSGYLSRDHVLSAAERDFSRLDTIVIRENLTKTYPLIIKPDVDSLRIWVWENRKQASGKNPQPAIIDGIKTPATVQLPLKKDPYWVEMKDYSGGTLYYKGSMKFSSESKSTHSIQTWAVPSFHILTANIYAFGQKPVPIGTTSDGSDRNLYGNKGNFSLLQMRTLFIPGLSTSLLKAGLFTPGTAKPLITADNPNASDPGGSDATIDIESPLVLPALSCLLINEEFRMGVSATDYADVALLGSYTWYPDVLKSVLEFSHMTGHEFFIGGEISSRISSVNFNVKAGMQMYANAKANIFARPVGSSGVKGKYYVENMNIPNSFVISLGFTLGSSESSKGNNILRLYHW